ncbi:MAG: nucleotidyltransferase family protein, partial [Candidatus Dormibacteraceae bacterium]
VSAFVRRQGGLQPGLLPARVGDEMEEVVAAESALRGWLDAQLERTARLLAGAGIEVLVLKGPSLARTVYPDPALRPYDDLDLAVREADGDAAAGVLLAGGCAELPYEAEVARASHGAAGDRLAPFHRVFQLRAQGPRLELHLDPLQLGIRARGEEGRWHRARPVPGLDGVLGLGPADTLLHLAVHAQKHGFARLLWLKDVDLLLRSEPAVDWDQALDCAREEGLAASLWYCLELCAAILGTPVPPGPMAALRPSPPLRAIYSAAWRLAVIAALESEPRRRAVQFHAAESWRGMLPSLVFMGRRPARAGAIWAAVRNRPVSRRSTSDVRS